MTTSPYTCLPDASRTQWFHIYHPPRRAGVYEIKCPHEGLDLAYAYWTGRQWCLWAYTVELAYDFRDTKSYTLFDMWRGLFAEHKP